MTIHKEVDNKSTVIDITRLIQLQQFFGKYINRIQTLKRTNDSQSSTTQSAAISQQYNKIQYKQKHKQLLNTTLEILG